MPYRLLLIALIVTSAAAPAWAHQSWWNRLLGTDSSETVQEFTEGEVVSALKQALQTGTLKVVTQLGQAGGFQNDPNVGISLPGALDRVDRQLDRLGLSSLTETLKARMNQAAEAATPLARQAFLDALQDMTVDDAFTILQGEGSPATAYFKDRMSSRLSRDMQPIVTQSLQETGVTAALDAVMTQYRRIPFAPTVDTDLTTHITQGTIDGIIHYVAEEEAKIRANPGQATTDLVKRVFKSLQ